MFDELLNAMDMVGFLDEVMHEAVNTLSLSVVAKPLLVQRELRELDFT